MGYLRLFGITLALQVIYYVFILGDKEMTILYMFGFSLVFTLFWALSDKLFPQKVK